MKEQQIKLNSIINEYNGLINSINHSNKLFIVDDVILKIKDIKSITPIRVTEFDTCYEYIIRLYDGNRTFVTQNQNDLTKLITFYETYNDLVRKFKAI